MKRLFDISLSLFVLFLLSPILLLTAVLVRFYLGSPVLFRQVRPGKDRILFNIIKFRTMIDKYDKNGNLQHDSLRLTKFGSFLRSSSLDELPELFNVLRGEMSLVGPRPLLPEYLDLYDETQARRHEVRPGITGWAQIKGRNALSWDERFKLDVWYIDNWSFWLDIKILCLTLLKVLKREDINQPGNTTMSSFKGNKHGDK